MANAEEVSIYTRVVSSDEFLAGTRFATPLEELTDRIKTRQPLGLLRRVLAGEHGFAVEFAPVRGVLIEEKLGYSAIALRWSNLTTKADVWVNGQVENLTNPEGLIFVKDRRKRPKNLKMLSPREVLGYFVNEAVAAEARDELDPQLEREYVMRAEILGIKITDTT